MTTILGKRFGELTVADVEHLVTEKRHEDRHLEYKRQLPARQNEAIQRFVESVASFANTEGGVVIFGVDEENHIPQKVVGLSDTVEDSENRRLESYAREHIDPPVTNLIPHWHTLNDARRILVLEIPRSLAAPHGIDGTFYGRQTGAKYPMPTNQLRKLFLERDFWEHEAEEFRRARSLGLMNDEFGLLATPPGPCLLVHTLPLGRIRQLDVAAGTIDPNWEARRAMALDLHYGNGWARRPNLQGWVYSYTPPDGGSPVAFLQFFRSGAVESYASMKRFMVADSLVIGGSLERHVVVCFQRSLEWLRKCDKEPPFILYLTLLTVRGYKISRIFPGDGGGAGFQEVMNYLPGFLIEHHVPTTKDELALVLKPMIDTVWQAAGSNKSPFYEGGTWHEQV